MSDALMTKEMLQRLFDMIYDAAREAVEMGAAVESQLLAGHIDGGEPVVGNCIHAPITSEVAKMMIRAAMETVLLVPGVAWAAHVTEAWALRCEADRESEVRADLARSGGRIADHPDRVEVVLINVMTADSQFIMSNEIHRNPNRLEKGEPSFTAKMGGTMVRDQPALH